MLTQSAMAEKVPSIIRARNIFDDRQHVTRATIWYMHMKIKINWFYLTTDAIGSSCYAAYHVVAVPAVELNEREDVFRVIEAGQPDRLPQ